MNSMWDPHIVGGMKKSGLKKLRQQTDALKLDPVGKVKSVFNLQCLLADGLI